MSEAIRGLDLYLVEDLTLAGLDGGRRSCSLRCGCGWRWDFGDAAAMINVGVLLDAASQHPEHQGITTSRGGWETWS